MFGTTFFVYDSGSKTNADEGRLDMAVIIYVRYNQPKLLLTTLADSFVYRIQISWDSKDPEI